MNDHADACTSALSLLWQELPSLVSARRNLLRSALPKPLSHDECQIDRDERDQKQNQRAHGRHAVSVLVPIVVTNESVCQE